MTTGRALSRQTADRLPASTAVAVSVSEAAGPVNSKTMADAERAHIAATLRETNGKIGGPQGAAALLGLARTTLLYRMQRLGISSGTSRRRFSQMLADLPTQLTDDRATALAGVAG